MNNRLMEKIDGVCQQIDTIFQNNEGERQDLIIGLADMVSKVPDDATLEEVVREVEEAIQTGVHNAKLKILEYIGGGDA